MPVTLGLLWQPVKRERCIPTDADACRALGTPESSAAFRASRHGNAAGKVHFLGILGCGLQIGNARIPHETVECLQGTEASMVHDVSRNSDGSPSLLSDRSRSTGDRVCRSHDPARTRSAVGRARSFCDPASCSGRLRAAEPCGTKQLPGPARRDGLQIPAFQWRWTSARTRPLGDRAAWASSPLRGMGSDGTWVPAATPRRPPVLNRAAHAVPSLDRILTSVLAATTMGAAAPSIPWPGHREHGLHGQRPAAECGLESLQDSCGPEWAARYNRRPVCCAKFGPSSVVMFCAPG